MANEKKITRTIITGYNYDVFRKTGNTLELQGTLTVPSVIRSIKEQKKVLTDNKYCENDILVMTDTELKKYEMSETDFIKYATVVTDIAEDTANIEEKTEESQDLQQAQ